MACLLLIKGDMKKIILILVSTIVLASAIFAGWYFFIKSPGTPVGEALRDVLPFGSGNNLPPINPTPEEGAGVENGVEGEDREEGVVPLSQEVKLFKIYDSPTAGFVIFNRGNRTVVRYVDRATGHISEVVLPNQSDRNMERVRITNNTIPKIYEAHFRPDGMAVLVRSLKENSDVIENTSLILTPPQQATSSDSFHTISSTPLRGNMDSVAVSDTRLVYSLKDSSSVSSSLFNGNDVRTIISHPFTDWAILPAENRIFLSTKTQSNMAGYMYSTPLSGGNLSKILGPFNGLVSIPNPAGNRVAYSYYDGGVTKLAVLNLQNNLSTRTSPEKIAETIADKCVWGTVRQQVLICGVPSNYLGDKEPERWYSGRSSYSDLIWLFNTANETGEIIAEPIQLVGVNIDLVNPRISPSEDYLIFINKIDLSLWALKLAE